LGGSRTARGPPGGHSVARPPMCIQLPADQAQESSELKNGGVYSMGFYTILNSANFKSEFFMQNKFFANALR